MNRSNNRDCSLCAHIFLSYHLIKIPWGMNQPSITIDYWAMQPAREQIYVIAGSTVFIVVIHIYVCPLAYNCTAHKDTVCCWINTRDKILSLFNTYFRMLVRFLSHSTTNGCCCCCCCYLFKIEDYQLCTFNFFNSSIYDLFYIVINTI